jgi:hypothetical protein
MVRKRRQRHQLKPKKRLSKKRIAASIKSCELVSRRIDRGHLPTHALGKKVSVRKLSHGKFIVSAPREEGHVIAELKEK